MITQEDYNKLKQQCDFYRGRMEAAEAKLSLALRGYSLDDEFVPPKKKKQKKEKKDAGPTPGQD